MHLGWVPREQNVEMAASTNEDFSSFDLPAGRTSKCCRPSCLPQLDAEIRVTKAAKAGAPADSGKRARFRKGDPRWSEPL